MTVYLILNPVIVLCTLITEVQHNQDRLERHETEAGHQCHRRICRTIPATDSPDSARHQSFVGWLDVTVVKNECSEYTVEARVVFFLLEFVKVIVHGIGYLELFRHIHCLDFHSQKYTGSSL